MDIAETIHRAIYKQSGYLNANKHPEFQAGFQVGDALPKNGCVFEVIEDEFHARNRPERGTKAWAAFREWKRGLMAARLQKAFMGVPPGELGDE